MRWLMLMHTLCTIQESMYIFLSSLISLLLVAVYVPAMLTMAGFTQVLDPLFSDYHINN